MVDERQRQRQMMTTDPNRQHYGPAGGPNKWDMDYPSGGMPTNYQGNSPHLRSGNLDVRYPGDYAHQQMQGRPYGGPGQPSHGFWQQMRVPEDTYPHELQHQGMPRQHPNPRMRGMMGGIGGLQEQEQAGLWQDIKRILKRTKNPGPLIDQWTDHWNQTADASGIGSTDEYQMAELTQDQMNMMGNPLNTPDFGVSKEDLFDRVKGMEDKGFFGWGAQEPTTQEEYDDYYNKLLQGEVGNWVT